MTNLFKKISVFILFPKGEGSNENFTELLMQMKSDGSGLFPVPSETQWQHTRIFHRREIQSVGHVHWLAIHTQLVMESCTTARFQLRKDRGDRAAEKFLWIWRKNTKFCNKNPAVQSWLTLFPQLWKTVLALFISSVGTSFKVWAEEENHCKWHGTGWSFG